MISHRLDRLATGVVTGALVAGALIPAASAQAATGISAPTITAPMNGLGPYVAGTPVVFTFSPGVGSTPVCYEYQLNGGKLKKIKAVAGTASVALSPTRRTSYLYVYAVAADGTTSASTLDEFYATAATPAADKDFNGDGVPDLVTVGGPSGLGPGLWLAAGDAMGGSTSGTGHVDTPAVDIGINGNGFDTYGGPFEFNGAQAITGQFTGNGFQDVLLYYPSGNDAGGGVVLAGSGDGSPILPISGNTYGIPSGGLTDANGDNPLQIVNAYASIYSTGLPDLIATSGDASNGYYLDYYATGAPGSYVNTFRISTATPDGTTDWNQWTLATQSYSGGTGLFLWDQSTGALYLWEGVTVTDNGDGVTGSISYTQYKISANWNKGATLTTIEAADFNGSGVPDLWTVTPAGVATAYTVSNLSTTAAATIDATHTEKLF